MERLKRAIYEQMDVEAWAHPGISPINRVVIVLILASVVVAVLQTEPALSRPFAWLFDRLDRFFLAAFIVEYLLRVWSQGSDPAHAGVLGRLRYMITWPALVDLAAILPFLVGVVGSYAFLIRLLRIVRIMVLLRHGPFANAMQTLGHAISERRFELFIAFGIAGSTVFVAAVFLYFAEGRAQPEAFGSIPRALWWGVATITTVGYGDVSPVTPFGKICAGLFMLGGIAVIALPAGIFAAAISELLQSRRQEEEVRRTRIRERETVRHESPAPTPPPGPSGPPTEG